MQCDDQKSVVQKEHGGGEVLDFSGGYSVQKSAFLVAVIIFLFIIHYQTRTIQSLVDHNIRSRGDFHFFSSSFGQICLKLFSYF